jgi:cytochrome c oxidase assembly protein subunit 15
VLACAIYVAIIWTAQRLGERPAMPVPPRIRLSAMALLLLVLLQIYLGALVAGLRAGYVYNTWPLIDGALIPDSARLFLNTPAWRNFFENTLTVQFDHRMVAYTIFVCALLHAFDVARTARSSWVVSSATVLALAVTVQAALGIWTLLERVPITLALMHQSMAMLVLTVATTHAALVAQRAPRSYAASLRS